MDKLTLHRWVIPVFVALVIVGGLRGRYYGEVFPIAPWAMYSHVYSEYSYYTILVRRWKGEEFDPPRTIEDVPGFYGQHRHPNYYYLLKDFGSASRYLKKNGDKFERADKRRKLFEKNNFPDGTQYEVLFRTGDLFEVFHNDNYDEEIPVGVFTKNAPWPEDVMREHDRLNKKSKGSDQ